MSVVSFIRRCLDSGMPLDKTLVAAEVFEELAPSRLPSPAAKPREEERVWVYVMGVDHPDDELVKVGISKHPNYRRETLEKERGLNLYVAHTEGPYSRAEAAEIESNAHRMLAASRERGEWFLCGVEKAVETVATCAIGASL